VTFRGGVALRRQGGVYLLARSIFCCLALLFFCSKDASWARAIKYLFVDVTLRALGQSSGRSFGNAAIGDFDGDGYLDLYLSNHWGMPPKLYRNNRDETFSEMIESSGLDVGERDRHGAAWGDFDNDGDLDLYLSTGANHGRDLGQKRDSLYRNDGGGKFVDISSIAGTTNSYGRGRSANWIDVDNDGNIDLFLKNFSSPNVLYHNNGNSVFTDIAPGLGLANILGEVSTWGDFDNDGDMDLFVTGEDSDQLLRNDRRTFTNITIQCGLKPHTGGTGAAWGDFNNDQYLDLYITRRIPDDQDIVYLTANEIVFAHDQLGVDGIDFKTTDTSLKFDLFFEGCRDRNKIYLGAERKIPDRVPLIVSKQEVSGRPEMSRQDQGFFIWHDHDSWHVLFTSNGKQWANLSGIISTQNGFFGVQARHLIQTTAFAESELYRNNGNGTFTEVTDSMNARYFGNARAAAWGDFNNDGFQDLYIAEAGNIAHNASGALFQNYSGKLFNNVTGESGILPVTDGRGDGASWLDFNNDGALDLLLTNGSNFPLVSSDNDCAKFGSYLLFKNLQFQNHWIDIRLVGTRSNRCGIGARVLLQSENLLESRQMKGGSPFYSEAAGPIHFGIGRSTMIESLTIYWPSGIKQILRHIPADQILTVVEDGNVRSAGR
jgi:ASPIC and UnbV/FG-GAP-like repeat